MTRASGGELPPAETASNARSASAKANGMVILFARPEGPQAGATSFSPCQTTSCPRDLPVL
eukprot:14339277-Alexandrium_andersonii.AAC.1